MGFGSAFELSVPSNRHRVEIQNNCDCLLRKRKFTSSNSQTIITFDGKHGHVVGIGVGGCA